MAALLNLGRRRLLLLSNPLRSSYFSAFSSSASSAAAAAADDDEQIHHEPRKAAGRWLTLPPFTPQINASAVGRNITGRGAGPDEASAEAAPVTALKWVRRCCPELPEKLVQKLFRLRQVRKEQTSPSVCAETQAVKRVSAKDSLVSGDVILLPITVQRLASEKSNCSNNEDEIGFVRGLELYKDPAIIVLNKPPGMPVQGGVGIKYSVDVLAASSLRYDLPESPRLVHRLDQDSSGVLVLGRTQTSATILHSIFREKTSEALSDNARRALQRKYWALVIGTPKSPKGLISAPLAKMIVEDGKSERVTIARNMDSTSSQHALTEYKVIKSSSQGYTWLELCPLTGRKHQLRVHCAEILGTPIVGDYKYGWQAHRRWDPVPCHKSAAEHGKINNQSLPFGLDFEGGSISEKQPRLHLHCRQMILPNISVALQHLESSSSTPDLSNLRKIHFLAPLPLHMQTSWSILGY